MFGTLGGPELFLILVVALIVFGPRKLPEIGKSVGRMMAEFRKASNDFRRTIEDEVEAEKLREATRIDAPSWSPDAPVAALPPAPPVADPAGAPAVDATAAAASGSESGADAAGSSPVSAEAAPDAAPEAAPAETVSRGTVAGEPK